MKTALLLLAALICQCAVAADTYPARPVRVIVNFPPGAGVDIATRLVTTELAKTLGQQFIIDNRPGAAGNIGVELAAHAAPDGYTLLSATAASAISQTIFSKISYDLNRDFAPVAMIATSPFVLAVNPSQPVKTLQELISLAKSKPGQLTYATPGTGSSPHLAFELFKMLAGVDILHVPYKGMVPAVTDTIGGNVSMTIGNTLTVMPNVRSGRLRGIAITTATRSAVAPDLPTFAESGVAGFESGTWYGIMAPANTPREIVIKLNAALLRALQLPDVRAKLMAQGAEPLATTPGQMRTYLRNEIAKWGKVAKASGAKFE
ncbi:MAG: tripartite tricarboxylate transporter substrate binding protein [Burkholderiales bacterium]